MHYRGGRKQHGDEEVKQQIKRRGRERRERDREAGTEDSVQSTSVPMWEFRTRNTLFLKLAHI